MDSKKRKALEAAGWRLGDAADFLKLSDAQRQMLDARVELALAIRRQREASGISQKELGMRLKTSQPRVAKIERAARDVSLDQLVKAFTAAGGKLAVRVTHAKLKSGKGVSKRTPGILTFQAATSE